MATVAFLGFATFETAHYLNPELALSRSMHSPRLKDIKAGGRDAEIEKAFADRNLKLPTKRIKITFVPEVHFRPDFPQFDRKTQLSQFKIIHFLLNHSGSAVFIEGKVSNLTSEDFENRENIFVNNVFLGLGDISAQRLSDELKRLYPSGIPEKFSNLSRQQAMLLQFFGGTQTLWYLGQLKEIYGAEDIDLNHATVPAIQAKQKEMGWFYSFKWALRHHPDFKKVIATDRELEALARVAAFNQANPEREIVLIYGSLHQFESYSGKYFDIQVAIP